MNGDGFIRDKCRKIYTEAFGDSGKFDDILFGEYFRYCRYICDDGNPRSMLFVLPCELVTPTEIVSAFYLYAAATDFAYRGRGYMTRMLERETAGDGFYFLCPSSPRSAELYEKNGFRFIPAYMNTIGDFTVLPSPCMLALEPAPIADGTLYNLMYKGKPDVPELNFIYPMK